VNKNDQNSIANQDKKTSTDLVGLLVVVVVVMVLLVMVVEVVVAEEGGVLRVGGEGHGGCEFVVGGAARVAELVVHEAHDNRRRHRGDRRRGGDGDARLVAVVGGAPTFGLRAHAARTAVQQLLLGRDSAGAVRAQLLRVQQQIARLKLAAKTTFGIRNL